MKITNKLFRTTMIMAIVTLFVGAPFVSPAMAFTDGPNNPGVGANVSSPIGSEPWLNPEEITTPGSPYATVTLYHNHIYSQYLQGSQYDFNIPGGAVILGIEVNINRMSSGNNPDIKDNVVSLIKAGAIVGDNKASPDDWSATLTIATYGGATDLWGSSWTPSDINSLDFGVTLAANRTNNGNNMDRIATVDTIQITVYYAFATTASVECGDGSPIIYGDSVLCLATVARVAGDQTPSGTVDWSTDESGTFDPNPCPLAGADGISTCSATYTPTTVGTGTHLITATYSGDEYFASSDAEVSVAVVQRLVTATADPKTKVYGDPDPELTFQITQGSLVFSDTFTGTITRDPGEDPGSYAILQGTLALPENYLLTYEGDYLTITKADADCSVTPYTVVYDANPHTATGTCTGLMGEPLEGLDLSATTHTDAGTFSDLWTFTDVTGYYNDESGTAYDTITPITITVTADPQTKLLGQPDPLLTYQVTSGSLLPDDDFTGELTRDPGEKIGTYAIFQGTLSLSSNYELTFLGSDLTITGYLMAITLVYR
jgi:hypothetical protein